MFKKIAIIMAIAASLIMMSCSDEKSSEPTVKDSDAFSSSMTGTVDDMMTAPGAVAMEKSSGAMEFLPFSLPVKSVNSAFDKIERSGISEKFTMPRVKYPEGSKTAKQEDHFVFADNLGTYTCTSITTYTDLQTGETYVTDSQWTPVYGGENITIIIPANVALDGKKFELVLYGFTDEPFVFTDEYGYQYTDYYPTFIDLDLEVNDVNVFALDFDGDWDYIQAADEVMPIMIDLTLSMSPFSIELIYNKTGTTISMDMSVKENNVVMLSISADVTFTDEYLEDVSSLLASYTSGGYTVEAFFNETFTDLANLEDALLQDVVDMINAGTNVYVKIKEGTNVIGVTKAKLITVTDEYETYEDIYVYIKFNDGSEMTQEQLMVTFGGYLELVGK